MGIIINRFAVGFSVCGEGYMYARLFLRIQAFNLGDGVTIWKLGRTVCVYSTVQRKEKKRLEIYTGGISPAAVTVYQTCNIMYICNRWNFRAQVIAV